MSSPVDAPNTATQSDEWVLKAADLLATSVNAVLLLSTTFLAALIAYANGRTAGDWQWTLSLAVVCFAVSSILAVVVLNTLINKVHRAQKEGVRNLGVRIAYVAATIAFSLALVFGSVFVTHARTKNSPTASRNTVVTDTAVTVGTDPKSRVVITKSPSGKIERVEIAP